MVGAIIFKYNYRLLIAPILSILLFLVWIPSPELITHRENFVLRTLNIPDALNVTHIVDKGGNYHKLNPDFSTEDSSEQINVSNTTLVATPLPYYEDGETYQSDVIAQEEGIPSYRDDFEEQSIAGLIIDKGVVIPDAHLPMEIPELPSNLTKAQTAGRLIRVYTNDKRILATVARFNKRMLSTNLFVKLPTGKTYRPAAISKNHSSHPRQLIARDRDFIYHILKREAEENLPFGSLVVSGIIETKLGSNMGSHYGGYCNSFGYCGYYQFGAAAWSKYGSGPFKPNVKNKYKTLEATIRLKKGDVRLSGKDPYSATPFELYGPHQQGAGGSKLIWQWAGGSKIDYSSRFNKTVYTNMANNVKGYWKGQADRVVYYSKGRKRVKYVPRSGYSWGDMALTWYSIWNIDTLVHESRALPILLAMKNIKFEYY